MLNEKTFRIMKHIAKRATKTDDTTESQDAWENGAKDVYNMIK